MKIIHLHLNRLRIKRHPTCKMPAESTQQSSAIEPNYSGFYEGYSRFVIAQDQADGQKAGFVLTRDGLSWKMTEIVMPNKSE